MELYLPDIKKEIGRRKAGFLSTGFDDVFYGLVTKKDKPVWWDNLVKQINDIRDGDGRFIFDSGSNNTQEEIEAFHETAAELRAAGLFRLPYQTVWIEDYFAEDPNGMRYCYLIFETPDGGFMGFQIQYHPDEPPSPPAFSLEQITYVKLNALGVLYWEPNSEGFIHRLPVDRSGLDPDMMDKIHKRISAATFMLEKFIATLAASNTVREAGETRRRSVRPGRDPMSKRDKDFRTVIYPYTHVRPPDDDTVPMEGDYRPRARHFVRGYTWGRHTRPKDQQRWIAPFWRGRGEKVLDRDHYEIKSEGVPCS